MKFKLIVLMILFSLYSCKMKEYPHTYDNSGNTGNDIETDNLNDADQDKETDDGDGISIGMFPSQVFDCNREFSDIHVGLPDKDYAIETPDTDTADSDMDYNLDGDVPDNDAFFLDEDVAEACRTDKAGIVLTFDDLFVSNWYKMHQDLFVDNGVKATFFLSRVYYLSEGSTSVTKLREMIDFGHEMGCHTMNHKNLLEYLEEKTVDQYIEEEIEPSIEKASSLGINFKSFAYPYGGGNSEVDERLFEYFDVIRYTGGILDENNTRHYYIDRCRKILRSGAIDYIYNVDEDDITAALERAKEYDAIIIILAHRPVEGVPEDQTYHVSFDLLQHLIDESKRLEMPFYTISEVFGKSLE